jgi:hypothetical protein
VRKHVPLVIDVVIAVAWALVVSQYDDIQTRGQWAGVLGATILAGALSGRYRVIPLSILVVLPVAALLGTGGNCDTGCDEDPVAVTILFVLVLVVGISAVMALGVFLRKEWKRRRSVE